MDRDRKPPIKPIESGSSVDLFQRHLRESYVMDIRFIEAKLNRGTGFVKPPHSVQMEVPLSALKRFRLETLLSHLKRLEDGSTISGRLEHSIHERNAGNRS